METSCEAIRESRVSSCTISGALPAAHHNRERWSVVEGDVDVSEVDNRCGELSEVYKCAL